MNILLTMCLAASLLTNNSMDCAQKASKDKTPKIEKKNNKKMNSDITIGTIIYNWKDIEGEMKKLSDSKFTSCQINYSDAMDAEFAKKLRETADKYKNKNNDNCGSSRTLCLEFRARSFYHRSCTA